MKITRPLCCAAATAACLIASSLYANSIVDTTGLSGGFSLDPSAAQARYQAELTAAIEAQSGRKPHKIIDNTAIAYRLDILGDLFTPQEKAALSTSSKLFGSGRDMLRAMESQHENLSERGSGGAAYSRAISTSFLTAADPTGGVWAPLTSWSVPNGSVAGALINQAAPMAWDFSEKSRGPSTEAATFVEKAVIFLPGGGSVAAQLEMAEFKVLFQSVISGRYPEFSHMGDIDYHRFCKVWLRRVANVAMAGYIAQALTPRETGRPGMAAAKLKGPPPVTVNYRF